MEKNIKLKDWICLSLFAVFCVSTFSTYFFVPRIGFNAIELVLVPLIIIYPRYIRNVRKADWLRIVGIVGLLLFIALFFLRYDQIRTLYSPARSYLIFFIAFFLFYRNPFPIMKYVFYVALISKVFDLIGAVFSMQHQVAGDVVDVVNASNILTTPIILAYAYWNKSKVYYLFVCTLCLVAAFCTVTRGVLLYTIIDIALCFAFRIRNVTTIIKGLVVITLIGYVGTHVYLAAEDSVKDFSRSLHHRLYTKVLEHDNAVTGDKDRVEHITYMIENVDEALLPHGIPSRDASTVRIKENRMLYAVQDSSLVELFYVFGFVAIILLYKLFKMTLFYTRVRQHEYFYVIAVSLVNLIICLPMGYGLFMYPPVVFTLGAVVGVSYKGFHNKKRLLE